MVSPEKDCLGLVICIALSLLLCRVWAWISISRSRPRLSSSSLISPISMSDSSFLSRLSSIQRPFYSCRLCTKRERVRKQVWSGLDSALVEWRRFSAFSSCSISKTKVNNAMRFFSLKSSIRPRQFEAIRKLPRLARFRCLANRTNNMVQRRIMSH